MGTNEREIINNRLLNLKDNERLFRINSGMGWVGQIIGKTKNTITLKNPRPLHGAPAGWPDLAGWTTIKITPDMIGKEIAVFTAEEIKTGKQKLSKIQIKFRDIILKMGGIFKVIKN